MGKKLRYMGPFPKYRGHRMVVERGGTCTVDDDLAAQLVEKNPGWWEDLTSPAYQDDGKLERWNPGPTPTRKKGSAIDALVVIVLTWNQWSYTRRCLPSIESERPMRVIVVDNNSTDGTRELLEQLPVDVEQPQGRVGVAAALNVGLEAARSYTPRYVAILNNDVVLPKGYLDGLVAMLEADPSMGMATGLQSIPGGRGVSKPELVKNQQGEPIDDRVISGDMSAFVLDWRAVLKVGTFDERFRPRYIEDNDYVHRLTVAGFEPYRTGRFVYEHFHMTTYRENPHLAKRRELELRRNVERYVEKWGAAPTSCQQWREVKTYPDDWTYDGGADEPLCEPEPVKARHVAIVQPGRLGDIVATLPLARVLGRRKFRVHWYAREHYASIFEHAQSVHEVHALPMTGESPFDGLDELRDQVEAERYEYVFNPCISDGKFQEFERSPLPYADFLQASVGVQWPKRPEFKYKRDDRALARQLAGRDERPGILVAPFGISTPVVLSGEHKQALKRMSEDYDLAICTDGQTWPDLPGARKIGRVRPLSLLGAIVGEFDLVICVSTSIVWFAYAARVPTIQLLPSKPWRSGIKVEHDFQKYGAHQWHDTDFDVVDFFPNHQTGDAFEALARGRLEHAAFDELFLRDFPFPKREPGKVAVFYPGPSSIHPDAGMLATGVNMLPRKTARQLIEKGVVFDV